MKIPNDNGVDYRLKKFVEYQHVVPPVHQNLLSCYVEENDVSHDDMVYIAWLMANTYHELTTILIYEEIKNDEMFYERFVDWWAANQNRVQFGSAKKYIKMNNRILTVMKFFSVHYGAQPFKELSRKLSKHEYDRQRYEAIKKLNKNCKNFGRFAEDLFLEILMLFQNRNNLPINIQDDDKFDWEHCANLTSATFNIMYKDDLADKFDKKLMSKQELDMWKPKLLDCVHVMRLEIEKTYKKEVPMPLFITKLCSFRNLFKNNRYGGFHHDRQLEYLIKYNKEWKEKNELWKSLLRIRSKVFDKKLLGEVGGWKGIRKERKKLWTTKGLTGVE